MTALVPIVPSGRTGPDISYADAARTPAGKLMIRTVENLTGRIGLIRRGGEDPATLRGADFWRGMMMRYGLHLDIRGGSIDAIPATGPLVMIANHPYGILDGLVLGYILAGTRPDFRILAHDVFRQTPELRRAILPVSFGQGIAAGRANVETRAAMTDHLLQGGAVGLFPGGRVSTAARPFDRPMDPAWRGFAARAIMRSGATVVPVWFEGANSRLFQVASHMNTGLRMALLMREFRARLNRPVRLAIGAPIPAARLRSFAGDGKGMMDFLRRSTYELAYGGLDAGRYGHDFGARYTG